MKTELTLAPHTGEMMDKHMRQYRFHKSALALKINWNYKFVVNIMDIPDNKVSNIRSIFHALCPK